MSCDVNMKFINYKINIIFQQIFLKLLSFVTVKVETIKIIIT